MRHIQEPLTLPVHPKLLEDLNNMSIAIKLWKIHKDELTTEQFDKLKSRNPEATWQEVDELLIRAYRAINEQRVDPRKY